MIYKIIVVGIGPGDASYILPKALNIIQNARILVGGRRALSDFSSGHAKECTVGADIPAVLNFIRSSLKEDDVVVMVSGDPGYYSLLDALRRTFSAEQIEVVPGLSSFQLAFARLALPWHHARLLSFHGRLPSSEELDYNPSSVLGMLSDGHNDSRLIAQCLLTHGWHVYDKMYICTHLSYEDEEIVEKTLGTAAQEPGVGHGVLIVCAAEENRV